MKFEKTRYRSQTGGRLCIRSCPYGRGLPGSPWREVGNLNRNLAEINNVNAVLQRHAINYRGSVHDRAIAIPRCSVLHEGVRGRKTVRSLLIA